MGNDSLTRFVENVFRHCMTKDTAHIGFIQAASLGDLSERGFLVEWEAACDIEAADRLHAEKLIMLGMISSSFASSVKLGASVCSGLLYSS